MPENQHKQWLQQRYSQVFDLIVESLDSEKQTEAQQSLNTCMKLVTNEGFYPYQLKSQPFPTQQLNKIIAKILNSDKSMKKLIIRLSDYAIYDDFCFWLWKNLKNFIPADKSKISPIFIQNFLELLNVLIPVPNPKAQEEEEKRFIIESVEFDQPMLRKNVNKMWKVVAQWNHDDTSHRQLLVLLLEKVLAYLDKPTDLTDYLMDSLDMGGQVALLALQGIFVLIHKHNMSYPNVYEKLYLLFEPEIFHQKTKARLFHLADIFLTSSYLPETLVAAFVKRLARLALIAPPQDIVIILHFISNLISRHPGLKRLICDTTRDHNEEIADDPYLPNEADPNKSRALQSSLWEVHLLKKHMLPSVAQLTKNIIGQPLPGREYDLGNFLELKENDVSWPSNRMQFVSNNFLISDFR